MGIVECGICTEPATAVILIDDVFPATWKFPEATKRIVTSKVCEHHLREIVNEATAGERITVTHFVSEDGSLYDVPTIIIR